MVLADPAGSVLADYAATGQSRQTAGSWLVEGIGEDFIPPIADLSRVTRRLHDPRCGERSAPARELLAKEGILAGTSTGTLLAAALRYCRAQTTPQARRHLRLRQRQQVPLQDVQRLLDARPGLPRARARCGDLRDLIARRHDERAVDHASRPTDTLLTAYRRMKLVRRLAGAGDARTARIVGIVDEEDMLLAVIAKPQHFSEPVTRCHGQPPRDGAVGCVGWRSCMAIFERGMVAIVDATAASSRASSPASTC